jgi:cytochrome c biogenesis protein
MTASDAQNTDSGTEIPVFDRVISFFSSVRTTVVLLFLLAAASIAGTIIPQETNLEQLAHTTNPFIFRLIVILDLNTLFHSWWFLLLVTLLALNLLGCLVERVPALLGQWSKESRKTSFRWSISDTRSPEMLKRLLSEALMPKLGARPQEEITEEGLVLAWIKHRIQLLGFPLIHCAIVVILLGGFVGLLYGYKGRIDIEEGAVGRQFVLIPTGEVRNLPFEIAVDKFTLLRYPSGAPKEFRSDLRLLEDGKEALKAPLRVNHPVTFKNISLYQADYRIVGVREVKLAVKSPTGNATNFTVKPNEKIQAPGTKLTVGLQSIRPGQGNHRALLELAVEEKGEPAKGLFLQLNNSKWTPVGDTGFRFVDFLPHYATGLQVGYDPGSSIVWIGSSMLIVGFLLALFTNHRRLYIGLKSSEGKTLIEVSGRSRRLRREFRESMEETIRSALESEER